MRKDVPIVPIRCNDCIDTGLVEFESYPTSNNPCNKTYKFVKPCTCSAAHQWLATVDRVVGFNKTARRTNPYAAKLVHKGHVNA